MSKADNKELEKAKEILNKKVRNYEINKEIRLLEKMTKEGREDAEAAKIVLEELKRLQEKTIEKDKIREKIEELEKEQVRVKNNRLIYSREDIFRFQIYILEELLEGE